MTPTNGIPAMPAHIAALIDEAQQAERAGRREIARRRYETALYLLRGDHGPAATSILRRIGRTHIDDGHFDAAMDCLLVALATAEALGETAAIAHALNSMGGAHLQRGDLDEAEAMYERAQQVATDTTDGQLQAMVSQNLGIIASMRGDYAAALDHYAAGLVTYRTVGMREYIGPVLNNMGLVYTHLERLDEAQAAYDEAIVHCHQTGDIPHLLLALINSTDLWLARGDVERAAVLCDTVLAHATAVKDERALAETFKHLGIIARVRGELDQAERRFASACEYATSRDDLLLAAETAREQAELYEQMGRNRETLQALAQSHRLFTRLRAAQPLADVQRRVERLERRFTVLVMNWAQTIESKDAYTLGHCERVANYACALARDVGIDEITMFWFRIGALLHDVGKIVVPSEILNKAGALTPDERAIMERHAAAGHDLLQDIEFPWDVLPMVRGHHERWAGGGYPDGLAGEAIPLAARIICVADVFDALTSERPYRKAFSREDALALMAGESGQTFDPDLFVRFERLARAMNMPTPARGLSAMVV
ncbi:MAG TPA: HD domain-containing phosphohydrolase [Gemmatimonadaceae bacterium]|nr:HD domain-containing phosphohydrolase [Gemmatimonadaceae bacterium]